MSVPAAAFPFHPFILLASSLHMSPFKSLYSHPSINPSIPPQEKKPLAMAQEGEWVTFEDEEAMSLRDLPVIDAEKNDPRADGTQFPEVEDFEFRTSGEGLLLKAAETDMCAADEVFFQGQILPLRPSISSDGGLFPISRDPSRCASRCESMDRYSSTGGSSVFGSTRSFSRSHSSSSCSSASEAPRLSISSNFYAHPSPKPHVCSTRKKNNGNNMGGKSTSSMGSAWGLFRLGLVRSPEIEFHDLRPRRGNAGNNNGGSGIGRNSTDQAKSEKKAQRSPNDNGGKKCPKQVSINSENQNDRKPEKKTSSFFARGFSCKCSPCDAVDSISSGNLTTRGRREEEVSLKGEEVMYHSRTYKWLDELSRIPLQNR